MKITELGSVADIKQYRIDLDGPILFPKMMIDAIREWKYDIGIVSNGKKWQESTKMLDNIIQYAYKKGSFNELYDYVVIEYNKDTHKWEGVPNVIEPKGSVLYFIDGVEFEVYPFVPPLFMDDPLGYWLERVLARSSTSFTYRKSDRDYVIEREPYDFRDDK